GTLDHDIAHQPLIDVGKEAGIGDLVRRRVLPGILEQREQRQQEQDYDDPEGKVAQIGVHPASFSTHRCPGGPFWPATRGTGPRAPPATGRPGGYAHKNIPLILINPPWGPRKAL